MKKALNIIYSVITVFILGLAVYIMIFGAIARKNNEMLTIFGYSYSYVPTGSMDGTEENSFGPNTIVITKKVKFEKIEDWDVIVFQSGDKLVIHRVVGTKEDGSLETKGDANNDPDKDGVTAENYQGKMVRHFKFFKLGDKVGDYQFILLSLIVLALVIYVIYQIFRLVIDIYKNKLESKYNDKQPKE